ncbi:hypothetical protein BAHKABFF_00057 [Salmonella phage CF-SP1]|nr:hypothetical protein BAHKABFF_00057 [Salmonella phage CF-SP1]
MIIEREDGFLAQDKTIPYMSGEIDVESAGTLGTEFISLYQYGEQVAMTRTQATQLIAALQKWVDGGEVE